MQAPAVTREYQAALLQLMRSSDKEIAERKASGERFYNIPTENDDQFLARLRAVEPSNAETLAAALERGHSLRGSFNRIDSAPEVLRPIVAAEDGAVVGFAQLVSDGEIQAHLSLVAVAPANRRQGLALKMLQEGLARFEIDNGRVSFLAPEANLADAIKHIQPDPKAAQQKPPWLQALARARLPLYDVHWPVAVVLDKGGGKGGDSIRIGLADGRVVALTGATGSIQRNLKLYDVVFVHLTDTKGKTTRADFGLH